MSNEAQILIISQDKRLHQEIRRTSSDLAKEIEWVRASREALKRLREQRFDAVVIDTRISDLSWHLLIKRILSKDPHLDVLAAIAPEEKDRERQFLDGGADEVFGLPLQPEEFHLKIKKLLKEKSFLESCGLVGKSMELKRIAESALQVAATNITVLITGESGTGKELVARAIHKNSPRKEKPFVAANVGALAEGVLESELFGHEKGAFTGAVSRRQGLFETAHTGSIFLDEIAEFKPSTQVKLLRVLEERSFMRVGGTSDIKVDVRVIAATNQNLEQKVSEGAFRADLYFRLAVVKIDVPPLRERVKDIPILAYDFIEKLNQESPRKILGITDEALELLIKYHWPGNVRELRNFLESMQVLAPDTRIEASQVRKYVEKQMQYNRQLPVITGKSVETAEHELIYQAILSLRSEIVNLRKAMLGQGELKPEYRVEPGGSVWSGKAVSPSNWQVKEVEASNNFSVEEMEKDLIDRTLRYTRGNRKKAARLLGIGERTLYRKLDKFKLR